jgi:hypothetical protein
MEKCKPDTLEEHPSEEHLEVHPAIELLIARMESNPKEFYKYRAANSPHPNNTNMQSMFNTTFEQTKSLWNRKEKRLYNLAFRKIRLDEAHERLMAALLV